MDVHNRQDKDKSAVDRVEDFPKVANTWPQVRALIHRKQAQGRGLLEGAKYIPWLTVREVPSRGKSNRILGWKTGRVHTFFSKIEEHYFYVLEWSDCVVDIREQFPLLPIEETITIADSLGVRHPQNRGVPVVMTLDFLVTMRQADDSHRLRARSIKQDADLADARVREKLTIERIYCEAHDMDWGYTTEKHISPVLVENVSYLHSYRDLARRFPHIDTTTIRRVSRALATAIGAVEAPLNRHTQECDDLLGLNPGTALTIVRHLLATRQWQADMNCPIHPAIPLALLNVHENAFAAQHVA